MVGQLALDDLLTVTVTNLISAAPTMNVAMATCANHPAGIQSRGSVTGIPENVSTRNVNNYRNCKQTEKCNACIWIEIHLLGVVFFLHGDDDGQ